jgi:hypothetical protein
LALNFSLSEALPIWENSSEMNFAQHSKMMLPSRTADWYDPDSISEIERDSLPEFFNGLYPSKTPQTYKE